MKTTLRNPETRNRRWFIIDANGQILGRLASQVAMVLMGKHKPDYTAHVDHGDFVVVTNCEKVAVTGAKAKDKVYERASGYHGGLRRIPYSTMMERTPEEVIRLAVRRMMPKNFRLSRHMFAKLKVYKGEKHPHEAQNPQPFPSHVKTSLHKKKAS